MNRVFHGLFVGIDRYASPGINELAFAERDARALHALFADTLGSGGELLVGKDANRATIEKQFENLAGCNPDDVVVISFSGHGSETHELVTYDADPADLASTCIPLDLLTEWFKQIPARHLVCIMDCCFSGGMGAKVLKVESRPRALTSEDVQLAGLAGDGRVILTASTASQPAWENARLGHGLLTYHLIEALTGPEEIREGDRLSIYQVLQWVVRRVSAAADALGKAQHPTLRGAWDGEPTWPVFRRGKLFSDLFPDTAPPPATSELSSLEAHGIPQEVLDAWGEDIPELNRLQVEAINEFGVLRGKHIVVSAPTSSGKTMIGELAALRGLLDRRRALFLLPLKALVNDKYLEFERKYGPLGFRTIRATGDYTDDVGSLLRGQYDVCLMTYEKCAALALGFPHILDGVGTIVVDEVQTIVDPSRGANLEFLLTLLRARRQRGSAPQLVALSAVIGAANGLERWLEARLMQRTERPVPLDEGVLTADGSFRFVTEDAAAEQRKPLIVPQRIKGTAQDWVIPLVRHLVKEGEQIIVFRETKGETVGCAIYLANSLGLPAATETIEALPDGDPTASSDTLRRALAGGVAFHNADLDRDERAILEQDFRSGKVKVIVATTTLAQGVNTPASSVVIVGLQHPGDNPYTVAEYKNMVGRAGRLGFQERGRSFIVAPDFRTEHDAWTVYVQGHPEDLRSRFLDADLRALVLRVLATTRQLSTASAMTRADVIDFLESSFGAFQRRLWNQDARWNDTDISGALAELEQHGLVEAHDGDTVTLTALGRLAADSGMAVESVLRILDALRAIPIQSLNDKCALCLVQLTQELDEVYVPLNRKGHRRESASWFGILAQAGVPGTLVARIQSLPGDNYGAIARAKKASACLLWIDGVELQEIERILMRHHRNFAAAGPVRSTVNRSMDMLPTVLQIAQLLYEQDLSQLADDVMLQLQIGVPSDMTEVAHALGLRLGRADYLALMRCGLASLDAIVGASDESLLSALNNDRSKLSLIRTLGEESEAA